MHPTVPLVDVAVVVAAAIVVGRAAMLAILLAADAHERRTHAWLIVVLAAVAAVSAGDVLEHLRLVSRVPWAAPFVTSALLVIGPALWLYARALTERESNARGAWRHFVPAALLFALLVVARGEAQAPDSQARSLVAVLILTPIAAQLATYLSAIAVQVRRTRALLQDEYSTLQGRSLSWLLLVAALFGAVLLVWVLSWTVSIALSNLLTNLLSAVALCVIGAFGIRQRSVFARLLASYEESTRQRVPVSAGVTAPAGPLASRGRHDQVLPLGHRRGRGRTRCRRGSVGLWTRGARLVPGKL
jgi:hypothetical protein